MKKKLIKYFVCMSCAVLLLTAVLMVAMTYGLFERRVLDDLRIDAKLMAQIIEQDGIEGMGERLDGELRVTLIDPQGVVRYDNGAPFAQMDNHASRPEVMQAIENGAATQVRRSITEQENTYYYAVRLEDGCVLRVAERASSIWLIYLNAAPAMVLILALMLGLCVVCAGVVTRRLVRPIEQMTARLEKSGGAAVYPELQPFMSMIDKQHEEILRSADMRVQFTANVSHELKTPLTSISGYAELIESGMAKEEQAQRFAGEIHKSASRLLALINDIIRLSQMDSPMSDLNLERVDLEQIAADTIEQLRLSAQRMGVTLELDAQATAIRADRRMMEELLHNLCDNAIRYNVAGGSVRVEVRPMHEQAMICVQDTGIGIPKAHQERVFERFYRVDKSRSKATGGTGLGLAIVKHIAAKHNATLALDSEPGRGTRITVVFERVLEEQ